MSSPSGSDIEALRLAREESRAVLDHQIDLLDDIDDKAMRTTRLALLLVALIVSVGQLMSPDQIDNLDFYVRSSAVISTLLLFASAFIGIGVYTVSDPPSWRWTLAQG